MKFSHIILYLRNIMFIKTSKIILFINKKKTEYSFLVNIFVEKTMSNNSQSLAEKKVEPRQTFCRASERERVRFQLSKISWLLRAERSTCWKISLQNSQQIFKCWVYDSLSFSRFSLWTWKFYELCLKFTSDFSWNLLLF